MFESIVGANKLIDYRKASKRNVVNALFFIDCNLLVAVKLSATFYAPLNACRYALHN